MLESVYLMGGLGIVIGSVLALASKVFYVYVDPKIEAIDEVLPGANCGGCGFPGCFPNAEAIVEGKSSADSCVAAGADVAIAIAGLMGVTLGEKEAEFAKPGCYYRKKDTDIKYLYEGIGDCRAAAIMSGGMKVCNIGCLGLGTCVSACLFGALSMGEDELPVVDQEKCTGCGACEKICPKNIIRLSSVTRRIMAEYTEDHCVTPCQKACPTGIDIREYIRLIKAGDNEGAVQTIKERNPFPTVIGRICPALCETECRRQFVDEPVAINHLKRFVCDIEMDMGKRVQPYKAPDSGKKIAVIGGGVAGLSTAFFAARLGHGPTVYESSQVLGGLLRYAIPETRLPQDVLEWDIDGVLEMGVKAKTSVKAGRDFCIPSLLDSGFDAVFTSTGSWDSRLARGESKGVENLFPGGYLLIDLFRTDFKKGERVPCGRDVVIAGGGALVPKAAAMVKELGARSVIVISRKTAEDSVLDDTALETLGGLNVSMIYNSGITKLSGEGGSLTQLTYKDLATGKENTLDADTLFISSGGFPELVFLKVEPQLIQEETDDNQVEDEADAKKPDNTAAEAVSTPSVLWEAVEVYKEPAGRRELGLLSRSDAPSGYSAVVSAINAGRKAAASIHNLMYGLPLMSDLKPITKQSVLQTVNQLNGVKILPRSIMPAGYMGNLTMDNYPKGFDPGTAADEADRCLRCGILCYEHEKSVQEQRGAQ